MALFPASYYYPLHLLIVFFFTAVAFFSLSHKDNEGLIHASWSNSIVLGYAFAFIIVVGFRPIDGRYFGDTVNYAFMYEQIAGGNVLFDEGDWLWNYLMSYCANTISFSSFLLIVESFYIIPIIIACKRWSQNSYSILLLFAFGAFSFFSYATNGIRNGMACSLVILALTYLNGGIKDKLFCVVLSVVAIGIHKSTMLPIIAMFFSYLYQRPKPMFIFWGLSIFISLVAGDSVSNFFESLGFDDRLSYLNAPEDESLFSHTGFRWDFLLYSFMPILLGWNVAVKHRKWDLNYLLLLGTYIYSNAFWIMVIRASYSNRFAYLSWFLYPFVLAYPLLKFDIWPQQGSKTALIMAAHFGFTLLMFFI